MGGGVRFSEAGAASFVDLLVGVDFNEATMQSYFIEVKPIFYLPDDAAFAIRTGLDINLKP